MVGKSGKKSTTWDPVMFGSGPVKDVKGLDRTRDKPPQNDDIQVILSIEPIYIYIYLCISIFLSISIYLSIYLPVSCLYIYLSIYIYLSLYHLIRDLELFQTFIKHRFSDVSSQLIRHFQEIETTGVIQA